ncbi:hypothetical protein PHJA_001656800 [Phtheirospermum japonicum]|uniref:DRBM domain-containing protein n=1 Tax=Phtheirospermum japonicum TaxID=374723 RepID=A0A830CFJ6_9LAMI|nr:hypothetical protein PHJA_001656800 [Phtheirospermum japonicum]
MASGSEIEANEVVQTWDVGPTEDVIQALMETLVDPLLPLSMHAVVLLYNYHHRKQKPELKFLDFVSFCKLAVTLKPSLVSFMKLANEREPKNSDIVDDHHLSITEKAVKGACDIALALDASRDFPEIESWPISKVVVLLIDSKKENCMVRLGNVTKGVWSLIEKEVNEPKITPELLLGEKIGDKRKRSSFKAITYNKDFLNLAYDAVKDVTGIGSSNLQVLEAHVSYSLSQEKSTVRLYMMQCSDSFSKRDEVSLKFLVERLVPFKLGLRHNCKKKLAQTGTALDLPVPKNNGNDPDKNGSRTNVNSSEILATEGCDENRKVKSSVNHFKSKDIDSEALAKRSRVISFEVSDTDSENTVMDDIVVLDKDGDNCRLEKMNTDELINKSGTKSDVTSNANPSSKIRVYHHRKKNNSTAHNDARVRADGENLKVNNALTLHHAECGNEKVVSQHKGDVTISCDDQNVIASNENQLVQFEDESKHDLELQNVSASEQMQIALSILYAKRQELCSKICNMDDTLASYENDIARIRDGGEVGLARECIKSILSGNYHSVSEHGTQNGDDKGNNVKSQPEKRTGLSEIYFSWKIIMSNVFVHGKEVELHSKGGFESQPREARESAAARMMAELRNLGGY